jgi:hypothetical protein
MKTSQYVSLSSLHLYKPEVEVPLRPTVGRSVPLGVGHSSRTQICNPNLFAIFTVHLANCIGTRPVVACGNETYT